MEYNSTKPKLRFPEYGRSVQSMIEVAKTVADDGERQAMVEQVVQLMFQMHPLAKSQEDIKVKIWKNVFAMADFQLNVTPPRGIDVSPEAAAARPAQMSYPPTTRRMRHYGYNVGSLIKKCLEMPDGPKKEEFTETIAAYMKLAYKTWNREHYVSDEVVKDDLATLSDGKLLLENHGSLDILADQAGADPRTAKLKANRGRGTRGGRSTRGGSNGSGQNVRSENTSRRRRK